MYPTLTHFATGRDTPGTQYRGQVLQGIPGPASRALPTLFCGEAQADEVLCAAFQGMVTEEFLRTTITTGTAGSC